MKNYYIESHTADLAIKGYGKNVRELYKNIAVGLFKEIALPDLNTKLSKIGIKIFGEDRESLLVNFLNELVFLSETKKIAFTDFKFSKLSDKVLAGTAYFYPLSAKKIDVKGATYHGLKIICGNRLLSATVIFDI